MKPKSSLLGAFLLVAVQGPIASSAGPAILNIAADCTSTNSIVRQSELPWSVRKAIPFEFADPSQPFQSTDILRPGKKLPFYRMLCAKKAGRDYVLHYERGGRGYFVGKLLLKHMQNNTFVAE